MAYHQLGILCCLLGGLLTCTRGDGDDVEEGFENWAALMREPWTPGRMEDDHTTRVPIKDLSCNGKVTALRHIPGFTWADVKQMLNTRPARAMDDTNLLAVATTIQQKESDDCVLGIIATSAYMTPVHFPKHRNMARVLGSDVNFLLVNVSFYEALRTGFPVFGIFDDMSTAEYRAWFHTQECDKILAPFTDRPSCAAAAAQSLHKQLEEERNAKGPVAGLGNRLLLAAVEIFDGEASDCRPAHAAASLVLALSRVQVLLEAPEARTDRAESSVNRDVMELVTRAEELIKDYSWDEKIGFGRLVASSWNLWWLLRHLQEAMEQIYPMLQ